MPAVTPESTVTLTQSLGNTSDAPDINASIWAVVQVSPFFHLQRSRSPHGFHTRDARRCKTYLTRRGHTKAIGRCGYARIRLLSRENGTARGSGPCPGPGGQAVPGLFTWETGTAHGPGNRPGPGRPAVPGLRRGPDLSGTRRDAGKLLRLPERLQRPAPDRITTRQMQTATTPKVKH